MSEVVRSSLRSAVKGTALLIVAIASGQLLWFLVRILIVRNVSQSDFGIYSLTISIISITAVVFAMNLPEGAARFISVSDRESGGEKRRGIIKSGFQVVLFSGIIGTLICYLLSDFMAIRIFEMPDLGPALRVMAFAVIFTMLLDMFVSVYRGFGNVTPKAAADLIQPLIYIVLLFAIFRMNLSFIAVLYVFFVALALVVVALFIYSLKKISLWQTIAGEGRTYRAELVAFSLPLSGVTLSALIMTWTDTLMLGYFRGAGDVGLYNVAASLARALTFPVIVLNFVFMPIAGELYAKGQVEELKRIYQVLAKWLFMVSFPIFLVLFFFPEMTLQFLFGQGYVEGSMQLKILSLRFMLDLIVGPGVLLLTIFGRTKLLMAMAIAVSGLNIVLNYVLIPALGLSGAALATFLAALVGLGMCTGMLYALSKIQPFTTRYIKPAVVSMVVAAIIYVVAKSIPLYFWMMPVYFLLFIGSYVFALLLTRSIEEEDIYMFEAITDKLGLELKFIRRLLSNFSHK